MPGTRRRPDSEFEQTGSQSGQQIVTLQSLTGGLNVYTNPELLSPQFWAAASNVYSGLHGSIRRARWAPLVNSSTSGYSPTGVRIESMFGAYYPFQNPWLFYDTDGEIWWLNGLNGTPIATVLNQALSLFLISAWNLTGPFMRVGMGGALLFQTNGFARSKIFVNQSTNQPNLELWGIDAPDVSPSVALNIPISSAISVITSNSGVVTIVTPSATSIAVGQFVTVYNVADDTFDSATGTAFQVISVGPPLSNAFSYMQPGPDRSSTGGDVTDGIVKSVGRSYSYAWENANTGQVSAPSPATVYMLGTEDPGSLLLEISSVASGTGVYTGVFPPGGSNAYAGYFFQVTGFIANAVNNGSFLCTASSTTTLTLDNSATIAETNAALAQAYFTATITAIEQGTISYSSSSPTITGNNTAFTTAWIGRNLYSSVGGSLGAIVSVASATSLTLTGNPSGTTGSTTFQVYDRQSTHIRFYATADGQASYLRFARNAFVPANTLATSGLQFMDTADSEPPNPPFTDELTQTENVPPPVGTYLQDYQGRVLVFGVPASPQSFFYSNIEATVVGQPPESFAPLNVVTLPIGDGAINGMANLPTGCMMWSNRQDMFKLTGTLTDNTIANSQQLGSSIQRLPYKIGCASPYATAVTSLGCFWLSSDREIWLFTDHYAPKNVGKPIQAILDSINGARIGFARMKNYKAGDRNWLSLAIATGTSTYNNLLLELDLDLLASNGQPSFFTFDMATNQPSWYQYNINCEAIEAAFDSNSINHMLVGDVDVITDVDWQPSYYTVGAEQSLPNSGMTLHALGNDDPEMIKTGKWMRFTSNQLPKYLASQGWSWNILSFDDDKYVLGINPHYTKLIPGTNSPSVVYGLEVSPALFKFGMNSYVKGRRFQIETKFPSAPGFYEFRSIQFCYDQIVAR